jgi:4-diphosphocytidyl-2-C-methyl-D-erythritol kinase
VKSARAYAKINLALLVGPTREDGLHEVATVLQRIDLADDIQLEPADELVVEGFPEDTLVRRALTSLAEEAGVAPAWRARIEKRIPVAAGLGGGSADAAAALTAANATLPAPLHPQALAELAGSVGADVPFFLQPGPKLAEGAGERLTALALPQAYSLVVALPEGAAKRSTGEVYARFDELGGGAPFGERRAELLAALERCHQPADLAALPRSDLAEAAGSSEIADELTARGGLRADVTGAGPAVYGVFPEERKAELAAAGVRDKARVWVTRPVW